MALSLGDLVDRLTTVNLKLWHIQAKVHKAAMGKEGLDATTVGKLHFLNMQRNSLMREIDETLDEAIKNGHAEVDPRIKIT
ncbi:MAG TPA: DUF4254 domain-containing protein [Candidatus Methylomirabilis sp.]|nr:DUF4254 domain-containing protein [Candidatus Methylomirabilis sp.]